jgi:hypothetical protein
MSPPSSQCEDISPLGEALENPPLPGGKPTTRFLSLDGVIGAAETRRWVVRGLRSAPAPAARNGKKRPDVDAR